MRNPRRPHRPIVAIALVLALATGAWFGQAYTLFAPLDAGFPSGRADGAIPGGEEVVRHFYTGIETFLTTGDDTPLRSVLSEDFVDHATHPGTEPNREGLLRYLGSLRQTFPDLRLEPRDVLAQFDRVVVRLEVTGTEARAFLDMSLAGARPWGTVDIFQVVAGRIVSRWGDAAGQTLLEPIVSSVVRVPDMVDLLPALTRRSYAPGTSDQDEPSWGPVVLLVESGSVVVDAGGGTTPVVRGAGRARGDPPRSNPSVTYGVVTLGPGDALTVGEAATFTTRNDGAIPAEVIVLSLVPSLPAATSGGNASALPPGVTNRPLAAGMAMPGTREGLIVSIGRAVLLPGAGLADHVASGQELVLVEAGVLALAVGGGTAWLRHPNQTATVADRATAVAAGTGIGVPPGAVAAYRNDGAAPLALLVATIVPASTALQPGFGA